MKVKCIQILNADGREVEFSPWLTLGRVYHVLSMSIEHDGKRSYGIISGYREGEWPHIGSHQQECFEVVSDVMPSNWRTTVYQGTTDMSPAAWQEPGFYEAFSDHDPATYPIFERERDIILSEDP
ncbi:MAG: hypothetical protein H7232_15675 [Aeromicrobium sp.]|nr:hypothetical protein [Burkholderiales bacterium]